MAKQRYTGVLTGLPANMKAVVDEIWKVVEECERFEISNFGRLRSLNTGKILSQTKSKAGYLTHATKIGGRAGESVCFRIHRLVAMAFLPEPTEEMKREAAETVYKKVVVNHKDGDKANNKSENLEWCTYSQNVQHAFDNGLNAALTGEDNIMSVLTDQDVAFIRSKYGKGYTKRELADMFGVGGTTIFNAVHSKTWKHVI